MTIPEANKLISEVYEQECAALETYHKLNKRRTALVTLVGKMRSVHDLLVELELNK